MDLPFFLKLVLTIFIFSTFPSFRCEEDANFTTCGRPYECGNIKNLSFPFWGGDRPEFCGHEGFRLRCENREYPVINISGLEYGVLNVSQENRTMTLARSDLWDSPCSGNVISTTLNYLLLDYAPTVENLTLIYGCPKGESLGGSFNLLDNFSCPEGADDNDRISYYVRENVSSTLNQSACSHVVQVPVFRTVLDEMESSAERGIQELKEVLNEGFDVIYIPFPLCSECEKAHGRCGTNTTTRTFTCNCSEGPNYECLRLPGTPTCLFFLFNFSIFFFLPQSTRTTRSLIFLNKYFFFSQKNLKFRRKKINRWIVWRNRKTVGLQKSLENSAKE